MLADVDQQQVLSEYERIYERRPAFEDEMMLADICDIARRRAFAATTDFAACARASHPLPFLGAPPGSAGISANAAKGDSPKEASGKSAQEQDYCAGSLSRLGSIYRRRSAERRRVLYRVEHAEDHDLEFSSAYKIQHLFDPSLCAPIDLDGNLAKISEVSRACATSRISVPLMITPISQLTEFEVWLPDEAGSASFRGRDIGSSIDNSIAIGDVSRSSISISDRFAPIAADILANELMFGSNMADAEEAKHGIYMALASVMMGVGIIPGNADELVCKALTGKGGDDLEISEIRRRICAYNSRSATLAQIRRCLDGEIGCDG